MCVHACVFIMNEYAHSSRQRKVWFRYGAVCYICHVVHSYVVCVPRERAWEQFARDSGHFLT